MHACENQQTHEIRLEGTVSLDAKTDRVLAVKQVTHATSVEAPRPQLLMFADSASLQSRGGHGARMFVHVEPTSIRTVFPVTDAQVVHAGSYPSRAAEATSELLTGDHEVVMSDRQSVMAGTSGEPMSQQMSYTEAREYLDSGPGLAPIKELLEAGRVTEARRKVAAMLKTGGGVTPWAAVLAEPRTTPVPATGRGDFTRNSAWLREHRHEHRGHWVALRNGVLLATNANRAELIATLEKVGDIDGALLVKVDP